MKIWIWTIIALLPGLFFPITVPASSVIHLKNGTSVVTSYYWEEGGQIRFYRFGGEVCLSKDMVHTIAHSDLPVVDEHADNLNEGTSEADKDFQNQVEQYQADLRRMVLEREIYSDDFRTAKQKKDQKAKDEAWNRLIRLQAEHSELRVAVENLYNGRLPQWWDEIKENQ